MPQTDGADNKDIEEADVPDFSHLVVPRNRKK